VCILLHESCKSDHAIMYNMTPSLGHQALETVLGIDIDPLELSTYERSKKRQYLHLDPAALSKYDLITLDAQVCVYFVCYLKP